MTFIDLVTQKDRDEPRLARTWTQPDLARAESFAAGLVEGLREANPDAEYEASIATIDGTVLVTWRVTS